MTIELLLEALSASWSRETAYKNDRKYWSESSREVGQCTVTSIIVYDYFGGKIIRGFSEKYNIFHYWNEVNGQKIDLTFKQFCENKGDIDFKNIIIKKKEDLLHIRNVKERYEILRQRVELYLKKSNE